MQEKGLTPIPFRDSGGATFFFYEGWNLIQEGPNAAASVRLYVHGARVDEIVATQVDGTWYYNHYDAQGNCILQSMTNGGIQAQFDYDAFGFPYFYNSAGGKGVPKTRFLFTGREYLSDLRLYDYRNRLYQPELGRFLQPDPKQFEAGDYNLYRYCHNDPVNKTDPTGLKLEIDPSTPILFQLSVIVALYDVGRTESGGPAISQLTRSEDHLHVITMMTGDPYGRAEATTPDNMDKATNGTGTGSILKIDPLRVDGSGAKTMSEKVAHAVGHGQDIDSGTATRPDDRKSMTQEQYERTPNEQNAIKIQTEVKRLEESETPRK
ncbi:MAG TPA: RHS repeat-associated core domain-containing protein [Chthoniobacterales bacterium]|nr:RHS repeat-associated core domain-containing protein [Chthoniobacterales bacterium]